MKIKIKKQAHKQTLPYKKINATQLTHQRNNAKHSNHCKEMGRGRKSLVSLHEKFLGSRCSYAKKNTDAVPFTSTCLVPHCKNREAPLSSKIHTTRSRHKIVNERITKIL